MSAGTDKAVLAEFKGAIREIEVYPGQTAEWWLVPVAAGRMTDLHCGVRDKDGKTHAEHGMTGEIIIREPAPRRSHDGRLTPATP